MLAAHTIVSAIGHKALPPGKRAFCPVSLQAYWSINRKFLFILPYGRVHPVPVICEKIVSVEFTHLLVQSFLYSHLLSLGSSVRARARVSRSAGASVPVLLVL